jgi:apolipoprotein N-acyltransferase
MVDPHTQKTGLSWRRATLLSLTGVAAFHLAFDLRHAGFLIAVFLFCLFELSKLSTSRRAFYAGLAIGLAVYGPQLAFFWTIFEGGALTLWLVLAAWLALFLVIARQCRVHLGRLAAAGLIPCVWTGLEYFRSELYYLRFSWCGAGYAFADHFHPFGRLGVYGIGWVLMLIIAAVSLLPRRPAVVAGGGLLLALAMVNGMPPGRSLPAPGDTRDLRVAAVQMEFPLPQQVRLALDRAIRAYPQAQLLVLSEYTFDGPVPELVKQWCRKHRRYLVASGKAYVSTARFYDTAFVVGPDGRVVFQQAKSVPIQLFQDGLAARQQRVWNSPWGKIGIAVCYDLSYRRVTDRLIRLGAQALIIPAMDLAEWGKRQHELNARVTPVRAAEYGVPILRVASSGVSQLVDAQGTVRATAPFGGAGAILGGVLRLGRPGVLPFDALLAPVCVAITGLLIAGFILAWRARRPAAVPTEDTFW